MKILIYILIIALSLLAPVDRLDVAKLQPVEAVAVSVVNNQVVLETDTEDIGIGQTAKAALENLKETTPAVIYLDTANYLLVEKGAEAHGKELMAYLKPSVRVEEYGGGSVKEEAKYLDAHDESARPLA